MELNNCILFDEQITQEERLAEKHFKKIKHTNLTSYSFRVLNWMKNRNLALLTYLLLLQAVLCISIILDVSFVRQVLGFIFFVIIPGFLLLRLIGIKLSNIAETVIFSVGLSVAFLSLVGVLINGLGNLHIVLKPLSTEPTAIAVNVTVFVLIIADYLKNRDLVPLEAKGVKFWPLLSLFILPILSIIGVLLIRDYGSNLLLIFLFIALSIIFVLSVASTRLSSKLSSYFPLIILSIVIALLLSQALISNYQYGADIQGEYNTFISTKNIAFWDLQNNNYYQQSSDNAMMSITVLPTVLSNLLNLDPGWIFKVVYPLIFSLLPLGLYLLYRRYWNEKTAFLSTIFFVANYVFFTLILEEVKQMIAEVFLVILFLILFSKEIKGGRKWAVFIIAFFGLMVSHYSMNFMFLLFIVFAWLGGKVFWTKVSTKIRSTFIVFPLCLSFLWYIFVVQASYGAGGPFSKFVGVIQTTFSSFLSEFFSSAARGSDVQAAIGLVSRPSTMHFAGTIIYDLTILFILVGFISLLVRWRKKEFDSTFFSIIFASLVLLISAVVLPRFSGLLELGRLYETILLFLSPLFVLGTVAVVKIISRLSNRTLNKVPNISTEQKKKNYCFLLTLVILIPFFLFQTGLVYEVTNDPVPSSITLSKNKMEYSYGLIHERDVFSAAWISRYGDVGSKWTFTDRGSLDLVLTSYSTLDRSMLLILSNSTDAQVAEGTYIRHENTFSFDSNVTYIYLSEFNVLSGIITYDFQINMHFNNSQIPALNSTDAFVNKIYSNGAGQIDYRVP